MAYLSATQGIRDEIASRLNEAESDNTDKYTDWINLGLKDLEADLSDSPFLRTSADRTLSSGTRLYAVPSDFAKMNSLIYPAGDVRLTYLEPEQFDILQPSATEGGSPRWFTLRNVGSNAQIEYYPSINNSITVHLDYQRTITTVSASSAVPDIPSKYNELLVLFGESRGLRRKGLRTDASAVQQEFEVKKEKMKRDLMSQTTENKRIKDGREFMISRRDFGDPIVNLFNT